jgi:hypothetical protein
VSITNQAHDGFIADRRESGATQEAHSQVPARLPLVPVNPGQQVLDLPTKLPTHAIGIAAFNTATAPTRAICLHTGDARATAKPKPRPAKPRPGAPPRRHRRTA